MKIGLRIPLCSPTTETATCVRAAEDAGFDIAWLPDSQFLWRDVWATLGYLAPMTSRIVLGTCVTNLETRHISVTASAAVTIEETAPQRLIVGVGSGDSATKTLGLQPTLLADMRERIHGLQTLLRGERLSYEQRHLRIRAASGRKIPVHMAATGPRMQRLAGEVADGVIVLSGFSSELIQQASSRINEGAARSGRSIEDIDISFGTICHVTDDEAEAAHIVKPYIVAIAQNGGAESLRASGIDIDVPRVVDGVYPDMSHAEDWDHASDVASRWVDDESALRYARDWCLVGDEKYVLAQLRQAAAAGVKCLYLRHFGSYTLPNELIESFGSSIIPAIQREPESFPVGAA